MKTPIFPVGTRQRRLENEVRNADGRAATAIWLCILVISLVQFVA